MRTAIIVAAALGFLSLQSLAVADEVARHQGEMSLHQISAPQRAQALAQAEGPRDQTTYGRGYAQTEGTRDQTDYGRGYAQAEAPNGAQQHRYAAA